MILGTYKTLKAWTILICYACYAIFDPEEVLTITRLGEKENDKIHRGKIALKKSSFMRED